MNKAMKQHLMTRCGDCSQTANRRVHTTIGSFIMCSHHAYRMVVGDQYDVTRVEPIKWTGNEHKAY